MSEVPKLNTVFPKRSDNGIDKWYLFSKSDVLKV